MIKNAILFLLLLILNTSCEKEVSFQNDNKGNLDNVILNKIASIQSKSDTTLLGPEISVLSYNVYAPQINFGSPLNTSHVSNIIYSLDIDIAGLQELDQFTNRNGKDNDQLKDIASKTGYYHYFVNATWMDYGNFGNGILSRTPFIYTKTINLKNHSSVPTREPRALGLASTIVKGKKITILVTHLDHGSEVNRLHQINQILKIADTVQTPIVFCGDFNDTPNSETVSSIVKKFHPTYITEYYPTSPSYAPTKTIDYIFYTQDSVWTSIEYGVSQRHVLASDHLPVYSKLKFRK